MRLTSAAWLTDARAGAVCRVLLVCWLGLGLAIPWVAPTMQVGRDFAAFWTAGRLALAGDAAGAYGEPGRAALAALFGAGHYPPFFYPPPALLLWAPFALLPFAAAAALWVGTTAAAYVIAMRAVLGRWSCAAVLGFPAVIVCALFGQNGLLSAALLAGIMASLDRRPALAGLLIGCFCYKPQLAVLAPVALACAGRWRALAAAAATVIAFTGASLMAFGGQAWAGFVAALPAAASWNAGGAPGFDKFASPYAAIRALGGAASAAWGTQGLAAAAAIAALVMIARHRPGAGAETAMLVVANGFCTPFLGQYDAVLFAVPGAWLAREAIRTGWLPLERAVLALLYLAPILIITAGAYNVPLAPASLLALATLVLRRSHRIIVAPNNGKYLDLTYM